MSEHRARGDRKRVVRSEAPRAAHSGRSRHSAGRSGRGRYLGVGTGLAVGLTGVLMQVDLGSPASGATIRSADTWTELAGAMAEGGPARTVALGADLAAPAGAAPLAVPSGESVVVDLHGHKLAIAPGGIALGHGSSLRLQDATAQAAQAVGPGGAGEPDAPASGMRGYDGRGGLGAAPPSADPQPFIGPRPMVPRLIGPRPATDPGPVPMASPAPSASTTAAETTTETAASQPAAPTAAAPTVQPVAHHPDRPRGRHRRLSADRHRAARRDHDDDRYCHGPHGHWVDEYYWWYATDAA